MDPQQGVFVSSLATHDWQPDPEVGGEMHVLCRGIGVEAGLSRFTDPVQMINPWTLPARETLLILQGAATVEIAGGPTLELAAGNLASLPKGARTTWHLTTPFQEFWVLG